MTVKETRKITNNKVREMCINNNYYTLGSNEEYGSMLDYCSNRAVTLKDIKV